MDLNVHLALNSLSFGDCSYHLLYQLFKREIYPNLFFIGNNADISCFDKCPEDFKQYIGLCSSKAYRKYNRGFPCLKLWHIQNSETSLSNKTYLFTFRELDQITEVEKNVLNNQSQIYVSCQETKEVFEEYGVTTPVKYVPLGFDDVHFKKLDKKYFDDGRIVFLISGKAEVRKSTIRAAKLWIAKYGNNKKYWLHLAITNPFFNQEQMNGIYAQIFDNKPAPFNVVILPYLKTRSELNDVFNCTNIVIDASLYETWSLPSFNCTALGKHNVIHHCGGVKGWSNDQNSTLFFPSRKEPGFDGVFFNNRGDFNTGNWYQFEDESYINALETAVKKYEANPINEEGLKLQKEFTWSKTVDAILSEIK